MSDMVPGVLSAVLQSLWVGGCLGLGAALVLRIAPGLPPAWRYRVWWLVLLLSALTLLRPVRWHPAPGLTPGLAPSVSIAEAPHEGEGPVDPPASEARPAPVIPAARPAVVRPGSPRASAEIPRFAGATLVAILAGGALLLLARLGGQLLAVRRLKRHAAPPSPALRLEWQPAREQLAPRREVGLRVSSEVLLPAACGFVHPVVLFPARFDTDPSPSETRCLLLHELAHLARRDDWALLAERALLALLWWHPVARWMSRMIEQEREQACDAMVAARSDPRAYARTLLHLAERAHAGAPVLAPGAHRGILSLRIERLLAPPVLVRDRMWRRTTAGLLGLAVLSAGVTLRPPAIRTAMARPESVPNREPAPAGREGGRLAAELDRTLAQFADSGFAGTVLLAHGDRVVFAKGYGLADRARGVPATTETRYSAAGMTKLFTATALLDLVHEGRLSLADTLGRWFPSLPPSKARVTLAQVLTYRDGLTRPNAPVQRAGEADFIEAIGAVPASFTPGTAFRYNDHGHSLLGLVLERVTGEPYESFIRRRYLEPASLAHTGFENEPGAVAVEYQGADGISAPVGPRAYRWGRRASLGLVSTAGDLFRWFRALSDPAVVRPETREDLFQVRDRTDYGTGQGYGLELVDRPGGHRLWRRVAGTPGFEGELLYDPEGDWTAVILVNSRIGWRFRVWRELERVMWSGAPAAAG